MPRIGITVTKGPRGSGLLNHCIIHFPANRRSTNRHVSRRKLLGKGHHIGRFNTHSITTKVTARATKPGNDFVSPKHNIIAIQYRLNFLIVAGRRHNNTTGTGNWLGNKGGDGVWALAYYHGFKVTNNTINKFCL